MLPKGEFFRPVSTMTMDSCIWIGCLRQERVRSRQWRPHYSSPGSWRISLSVKPLCDLLECSPRRRCVDFLIRLRTPFVVGEGTAASVPWSPNPMSSLAERAATRPGGAVLGSDWAMAALTGFASIQGALRESFVEHRRGWGWSILVEPRHGAVAAWRLGGARRRRP